MAKHPFTPDLLTIRGSVAWGQTTYWDCYFDSAPAPFNTWFPAFDADNTLGALQAFSFQLGSATLDIPAARGAREVSLSFYDNDQAILLQWLLDWYTKIHRDNGTTATLSESVRELYLAQLDSMRKTVFKWALLVFPDGAIRDIKNSGTGVSILQQGFKIAAASKL